MRKTFAEQPKVRFGGLRTHGGYLFELTGGSLCLDLANTKDERLTDHPRELLASFDDVVAWAVQARALSAAEGDHLRRRAAAEPKNAATALVRLVSAREVIFDVFSATAARRTVDRARVDAFNALAAEAHAMRWLVELPGGGFLWQWRPVADPDLHRPLWAAVLSAADLLTAADVGRVRQCEGSGCAWLFVDTSRNGSRRWCDMTVCGNRAKARRHRCRQGSAAATRD